MIDLNVQRTQQQIINAVSAWKLGQQQPLCDLVEQLLKAQEAKKMLAQRGYGIESQELPDLVKATPAIWW